MRGKFPIQRRGIGGRKRIIRRGGRGRVMDGIG